MAETTEQYRARINQLKISIENEPYMKNMRPDIAEGIGKTGNRQADIEEQFQSVIDGTTGKDIISAPEILAARNGEANLNDRLTKKEQEFEIEMAQNMLNDEQLRAYVDLLQHQLTSMGDISPEPYATYNVLVSANPSHSGVYVVTEDGNWYYWNSIGNLWDVGGKFQATGVADNSITPKQTTFISVSENLINPSLRKDGYMLGFDYYVDTTATYDAESQVTSYKNSFPTAVGDIIYSNAPGRLVWYESTNEVSGSTSFVLDESIGFFKASVGGGSKSKIDGYLDYINQDGYWFVSKNSVLKGKQEYGVTKLDSSIESDVFLTKDDLETTDLTSFVPKNLYCFDSNKNSKWINKDNVLVSRNPNGFYLDMTAPNGALRDWNRVLTQTNDQLSVKSALNNETVYTKFYSRKSVDPTLKQNPTTQKNIMIIGDSFIDQDVLPTDIKNQLVNKYGFTNYNFIGTNVSTQTIDGVSVSCNNEGRGGYTIEDFTKTNDSLGRGTVFPNPFLNNGIVDFSDYMTRNNITGSIDYVFINLGVNNLIMFGDSYETIKPKLQTLIDLIHADYPDCKIFINGLVMISKINGQYDVVFHNSKALGINKAFEELCESEANVSQCIYVDTAVFFDSEEGFQYEMQSYRGGTEEHKVQTDWLHPSDVGYYMISDTDVSAFVYYM